MIRAPLAPLCLLLPLGACWVDSLAVQSRPMIPDRPPTVADLQEVTDDARTQGSGSTALEPTADFALPQESDLPTLASTAPKAPETLITWLTGGIRAIATEGHGELAHIRLTVPNRDLEASEIAIAALTARLVIDSPIPEAGRPALRREMENIGGEVAVTTDFRTTRITVSVPRKQGGYAIRRLLEAVMATPTSRDRIAESQDALVRDFTERLAADPMRSAISRIRAYEKDGPAEWIRTAQDASAAQIALFHRRAYAPTGCVIAASIPGFPPERTTRLIGKASKDWAATDEDAMVEPLVPLPPPVGVYWVEEPGDSDVVFVLELPPSLAPDAAARLTAVECLTHAGVGGRIAAELEEATLTPVSFDAEIVSDGLQSRLQLRTRMPDQLVPTVYEAFQAAARSAVRNPPSIEDVRTAAARVRLRTLIALREPATWLDMASRAVLSGAPPTARLTDTGIQMLDAEDAPSWQNLIDQLDQPAALDLAPVFTDLASRVPLMFAIGGQPGEMELAPVFWRIPDATIPDATIEAVGATDEAQEDEAREFLELAVVAIGGPDRLRDIGGYHAISRIRSGRSPVVNDELWYRTDGYLRRVRKILATTIETVVSPDAAIETAGERRFPLSPEELDRMLLGAERHPLSLLGQYAAGNSRYRLISKRMVGDREMAVVERIQDQSERLRMEIDTESGLVRAVNSEELRSLGESDFGHVFVREEYRDYRNAGAGIRAPFYRATLVDDGVIGIVTEWERIEVRTPTDEELASSDSVETPK